MAAAPSSPPPNLDPPFRGYVETTFDALLIFEAARRGMVPRITRRLIDRERAMVQSGAVFVFDESESGIKRWTDGFQWSPSRIMGNFLIYRETDKKDSSGGGGSAPKSGPSSSSPSQTSPSSTPHTRPGTGGGGGIHMPQSYAEPPSLPILGRGALARPRSASEGEEGMDRQRERQLVGSLTNSYNFKKNGLVKKTMSVTVNGFSQHLISYYTIKDVLNGKLRTPSTIPELAALEIAPEYLHKQNFRFPPMIEVGQDGIPRYRGEPEEPGSPNSPMDSMSIHSFRTSPTTDNMYDQYGRISHPPPHQHGHPGMRIDQSPSQRARAVTVPMPIPIPSPASGHSYLPAGPSSATSAYFGQSQNTVSSMTSPPAIVRQNSNSSMTSSTGALRPGSSSRRFDPYVQTSPRISTNAGVHSRRQSQPIAPIPAGGDYYAASPSFQNASPSTHHAPNPYHYQPPATAPSAFADFGAYPSQSPNMYAPQYATWHQSPRFTAQPRDYNPATSSNSGSPGNPGHLISHPPTSSHGEAGQEHGNSWGTHVVPQTHSAATGWDPQPYNPSTGVQETPADWRGTGAGTSVG